MKIFVDETIYFLQKTGGISRYFDELIDQVKKLDPSVKVQTVKTLPAQNSLHNYLISRYLSWQTSGVFHSSYYTRYPDLQIPQIVTVYDLIYEKFPKYFNKPQEQAFIRQKKQAIQKANMVICISESVRQDVINHYRVPENKLSVIYLGVSPLFRITRSKKIKQDKPFLLYVGKRGKYKNFDRFARAFAEIHNDFPVNIVCVGGGSFTTEEVMQLSKLKIAEKVKLYPSVSDKQLAYFYNCAKVLIVPSLDEGFGLPMLEAMACGCPVAVSDIPVFREIGGTLPIYFNPLKTKSIVQSLRTILKKTSLNSQISQGLKHASIFTWEMTAKKTLAVYKKLAKN